MTTTRKAIAIALAYLLRKAWPDVHVFGVPTLRGGGGRVREIERDFYNTVGIGDEEQVRRKAVETMREIDRLVHLNHRERIKARSLYARVAVRGFGVPEKDALRAAGRKFR